jgi:hypothetical protein
MLALNTDRDLNALQAPELITPETEAEVDTMAAQEVAQDGAIPAVSGDGGALEPGLSASDQAFGDKPTAQTGQVDGGMFHPDEYHAACLAAGATSKWDDRYYSGHTSAAQWVQPYDGAEPMAFDLKPGQSASQAVKDFLAGPTIGNFEVIGVAMEMDELRDTLGDQAFDRLFGSADSVQDAAISQGQRLKITAGMFTVPFWDQMMEIAAGESLEQSGNDAPAPAVAAGVEQTSQQSVTSHPAPEAIAAELGVTRDEELV